MIRVKTLLKVVICLAGLLIVSIPVSAAPVTFQFPEPQADPYNRFFITSDYVYQFSFLSFYKDQYNAPSSVVLQGVADSILVRGSIDSGQVKFDFYNKLIGAITFNVWRFDHSGNIGYIGSGYSIPTATASENGHLSVSLPLDVSGGAYGLGIQVGNGFTRPEVNFSDSVVSLSDFEAIQTMLQALQQADSVQRTNILNAITAQTGVLQSYVDWFKSTYYNHQSIFHSEVLSALPEILSELDRIASALGAGQEQTTIAGETELYQGVNDLHDTESGYLGAVDSNNEKIGQYGDLAISEANGSLTNGFVFVKGLFDEVISYKPNMILMVFVLVFGVIMLILGKRVSRD